MEPLNPLESMTREEIVYYYCREYSLSLSYQIEEDASGRRIVLTYGGNPYNINSIRDERLFNYLTDYDLDVFCDYGTPNLWTVRPRNLEPKKPDLVGVHEHLDAAFMIYMLKARNIISGRRLL